MSGFPGPIVPVGHVEPVPRRIRATRHGHVVVDTTDALYVWEWPHYPQYYIPRLDVREDLLVPGPPEVDDSSLTHGPAVLVCGSVRRRWRRFARAPPAPWPG